MSDIISIITSNTVLLLVCILIGVMIIIAIIKRFLWLFITAALAVGVYAGYLVYNGEDVPTNSDEIIEHGRKKIEDLKENAVKGRMMDQIKEQVLKNGQK
ncbi:MAG: hypothetical protein LBT84_04720 [Spirochaetia bacterium]|jgi:amino acid permease|nr:hypothetical protein [Spirochaetia bacterium]